jgi:hypothetical protein
LSLSGFSVDLVDSRSPEFPRAQPNIEGVSYTSTGVSVGSGTNYEPPHVWTCNFLIDQNQEYALRAIFAEHMRIRRTNFDTNDPSGITLDDTTCRYAEKMPRTREMVSGTSELQLPVGLPTQTLYFARFKAWFVSEPKFSRPYSIATLRTVEFTLTESSKLDLAL